MRSSPTASRSTIYSSGRRTNGSDVFTEAAIVDYLDRYRNRAQPAPATYYRRFCLLRRFMRWVSRRSGVPDPFLDLEPPPKPRQNRDWLTVDEFRLLLEAAEHPERNLPGLVERDRLALLTLVMTGLRSSELCALDWRDLELDGPEAVAARPERQGWQAAAAASCRTGLRVTSARCALYASRSRPIPSSAGSPAAGCKRRSLPTSSAAQPSAPGSRST